MNWKEFILLLVAIAAVVFVVLTLEKCEVQEDCLGRINPSTRSAKECGL